MGKTVAMNEQQWDVVKFTQHYNHLGPSKHREALVFRNNKQVDLTGKRYEWLQKGDAVDSITHAFEGTVSSVRVKGWTIEAGVSVRGYFYLQLTKQEEGVSKLIIRLDWRQSNRYKVYSVVGRIEGKDGWDISEYSPTGVLKAIKVVGSDDTLAVQVAEEFKEAVEFIRRRLMYEEV